MVNGDEVSFGVGCPCSGSDSTGELGGLEPTANLVPGFWPPLDLCAGNGECALDVLVRSDRGCKNGGEMVGPPPTGFFS